MLFMACIIEHTRRPKAIYSSSFLHAYNNLRSDLHQSVNFPNVKTTDFKRSCVILHQDNMQILYILHSD